jgi:hypothetical protein
MTTNETPVTTARRHALVAAYGANASRWPAAERDEHDRAAGLGEARAVDRALDLAAPEPASVALRRRVLEAAPGRRRQTWWRPAFALVAAAAFGFVIGATVAPPLDDTTDPWVAADVESLLLGPDVEDAVGGGIG